MNRQKMTLLILVCVLIAASIYSWYRMPEQRTAPRAKTEGASSRSPGSSDDTRVHFALLDESRQSSASVRKNIFSIAPRRSGSSLPSLPPPPPPQTAQQVQPPPPPPPAVAAPPSPEEVARAEIGKFNFLGFLKKKDRKIMFLSRDNEIFLVGKGDTLLNRFRVTDISDESMTVTSIPDNIQTVIPLMENQPLLTRRK